MRKSIAFLALLLAFLPGALMAQTAKKAPAKAYATLEYSDDETQLVITDAAGNALVPADGLVLPAGAIVKTLKTTAELKLNPNGTIIKLSASTSFKIDNLKEADGTGSNDFALLGGKIRTVAAKLTGASGTPGYNVRTATANCGVRGTDFAMMYDPDNNKDWVCVQEGQVDFTNITTGATVPVAASQFANTFDPVFEAAAVDATKLAELFSDVGFVKLNPLDVPSKAVAEVAQAKPAAAEDAGTTAEKAAVGPTAGSDPVYEFLKKFFGLEVGSVTINGTTYSKAVLSPVIALDGFKLGLYLPIVYTRDMFDPSDWYKPAGNNEWSFGSDKSDWMAQSADFAQDLALKIKFLEWGTQGVDPYYLKLGNLKTMTLGHGTVVRNFANDQDFPSVRKIGLNAGVKLGGFTFEGLADDLANASVVGGRIALDLVGDQVVFGIQTTVDLHLAQDSDLMGLNPARLSGYYGDPMLLVGGLDLQLFKLDMGGAFRAKAFADVNTLAPYFRKATGFANEGFETKTIWHDGIGSFGGESGLMGNVAIIDYRLSFQVERGLYTNAIFQGNYYRGRTALLQSLESYLVDPTTIDKTLNMGVFGSAGFDLFGMLTFEGAYRWPFELKSDGSIGPSDSDFLKLALAIPKDKIPFVKLSGGISYERTKFVPSLRDGVNLFDSNTVLKGEVVYGLAQSLDLVIGVTTTTIRNEDGSVVYENGKPKIGPTVSLDTKLSL
jgi:hypothetical protein